LITLPPLYPILDTAVLASRGVPLAQAAAAILDAGAGILQFRHKGAFSRAVFDAAESVAELCRAAGALYVVNDRTDVALILGAGVHVGQEDLPGSAVRAVVGPAAILGLSTHNEGQFRAARVEPADYLAVGPIFSTGSKENPDPVIGVPELRRLRAFDRRPLVAIGGITLENAADARAAGADSVAVIGALYPAGCSAVEIRDQTALLLARVSGR
jgi:thiamine-phosphate pyrophosphorylase